MTEDSFVKTRFWIIGASLLIGACGSDQVSTTKSVLCPLSNPENASPVYIATDLGEEDLSPCNPSGRRFQVLVIANDRPSGVIGSRADGVSTALRTPIPKDELSTAERYATAAMQNDWRPLSTSSPAFEGCDLTCTIAFAYGENVVRVSYDASGEFNPFYAANIVRNATLLLAANGRLGG
jgi:hypothetical protein